MSRHIDKEALVAAVMSSTELDNEQKSQLIRLIREQKKYGLVWEDSTEDAWEKMKTSIPVLNEVDDKRIIAPHSAPEGATIVQSPCPNHAIIEADNLHALIALTYTHAGMIDVIYIDPPYNTGHSDFSYNDRYIDRDDGYRHSKWLSFMEKRLRIAKCLLSKDGIVFISIDDNEQADLKLLCDEIFLERNFVACVLQKSRDSISGDLLFSPNHNYLLVYASSFENLFARKDLFRIPQEVDASKFKNPDNDYRGPWKLTPVDGPGGARKGNPYYEFLGIQGYYRYSKEMMQKYYEEGLIVKRKNSLGKKYFLSQALEKKGIPPTTWWDDAGTTTAGTKLFKEIVPEKEFTNPKPISLITRCLQLATINKDEIILDFFAGSGTTLHATMQLNAEDGGHRQCILVTNNENNICEEVTYERNKRVIEGYTTPKGEQVAGLSHNNLRYYKLDFNPRKQSHQDNRELFYGLKDLLCIKENIYLEQQQFGSLSLEGKEQMLRYFAENGREMLMVYNTRVIPFIVNEIAQRGEQKQPLKIYIFADGAYPYADDFASVIEKVSLVPMPYAYYRGIKDSLPEETTTKVDDTELTNEEQQAMMAEAIEAEKAERKEDTSND